MMRMVVLVEADKSYDERFSGEWFCGILFFRNGAAELSRFLVSSSYPVDPYSIQWPRVCIFFKATHPPAFDLNVVEFATSSLVVWSKAAGLPFLEKTVIRECVAAVASFLLTSSDSQASSLVTAILFLYSPSSRKRA